MHLRLICGALLASLAIAAEPSAQEILQRTAAAYRHLHRSEFHATIQTIERSKVSQRQVTEPGAVFEQIGQDVTEATIAREEQYVVDGKPVPVYVVEVKRAHWPAGTLPEAKFAMYRIDQKKYLVHKVITYAPGATEIVLYDMVEGAVQPTAIVGMQAPDFTLPDTGGHAVSLRAFRGHVVLIDFWATWCPPCRALMPELEELHQQLANQGLVVLGLDIGEDAATVRQFAHDKSYDFTLLLGAEPDISAKYYVEAYPTTFVIDRQGRIAFRDMGGNSPEELRRAVHDALKTEGGA